VVRRLNTTDPIRRSQLILAGSLHLGTHEQHHLQAAIAGSMDMGINQSIANLKQRLAKEGRDPTRPTPHSMRRSTPSPTALATSGATS